MAATGADPRPDIEPGVRPIVARAGTGIPTWGFVALMVGLGIALFAMLDARRRQMIAPSTRVRAVDDENAPPQVPPLFIPPAPMPLPVATPVPAAPRPAPAPIPVQIQPAPQPVYVPSPAQLGPTKQAARSMPPTASPALVVDTTTGDAGIAVVTTADAKTASPSSRGGVAAGVGEDRARATMFRNRSTTVAQGTLIPAVLESALDSTRPGPARALVTRDVRGFDGSRVLIQRGSRLIGEYKADLQAGQNRALVIWTRLVRPDGAMIALASPSADTLGRIGIKGKVNSHFLERFASALLQTSLNIGVAYGTRKAGGDSLAVLAIPGAVGTATSTPLVENNIQRTLRVKQGISISVFVARDLDFTAVENRK